jgi:site-specific DNA-cytosine methylase
MEEFQFVESYCARWARVGNSVPPLSMKAIAEEIRCRSFMNKSAAH